MRALAIAALVACSPAYYAATGRHATGATLAVDFALASVGLAASVARYNAGDTAGTVILFSSAMGVGLAASMTERQ